MQVSSLADLPAKLHLASPPYRDLKPVILPERPWNWPPRGEAILWTLVDDGQRAEFEWLARRQRGVPLIVVLPTPPKLHKARDLIWSLRAIRPRGVLPHSGLEAGDAIRSVLGQPPEHLGRAVVRYLKEGGIISSDRMSADVVRLFELAPEVHSVTKLANRMYASRRTLGRRFAAEKLPVPSHLLQFARLLHVALAIQREAGTVFRIASSYGYPDGFTMSNQMKRLIGCRPSELRGRLGWEWLVESWLHLEYPTAAPD